MFRCQSPEKASLMVPQRLNQPPRLSAGDIAADLIILPMLDRRPISINPSRAYHDADSYASKLLSLLPAQIVFLHSNYRAFPQSQVQQATKRVPIQLQMKKNNLR